MTYITDQYERMLESSVSRNLGWSRRRWPRQREKAAVIICECAYLPLASFPRRLSPPPDHLPPHFFFGAFRFVTTPPAQSLLSNAIHRLTRVEATSCAHISRSQHPTNVATWLIRPTWPATRPAEQLSRYGLHTAFSFKINVYSATSVVLVV